ncbi:hypothetical protein THIOM_001009 [Candidatus Thiomargarita nelsonii]|uniref:Uncharacterized protein n=1 Tax=Candidatus Thiomargarita nelsonii TaxID=1003181 RepID=A0A176S5E9_9GAMM|nr:hypothetical protein THIOM_001009 [Candidatus Thiomargarita nelsonii]
MSLSFLLKYFLFIYSLLLNRRACKLRLCNNSVMNVWLIVAPWLSTKIIYFKLNNLVCLSRS